MKCGNTKYYAVTCKCGHVGVKYYIPIEFPIYANSKKEAAAIARNIPRCKHHHKDCILGVREIAYYEFKEIRNKNKKDPYLCCKSIQEQSMYDLSSRIVEDSHFFNKNIRKVKEEQKHQIFQRKDKIRNPKTYLRFYKLEENYNSYEEII